MASSFEKSALYPDISGIINGDRRYKYRSGFSFSVKLHTEKRDLSSSDGLTLVSRIVVRDYINNMADDIEVQIAVPLGTYLYDVYPHLENIEVTLFTTLQHYEKAPTSVAHRYKAVFLLDKNRTAPTHTTIGKRDLNQQLPYVITLQLIDRSAEVIRIKTTQGSFDKILNKGNKDMSVGAFMKSIMLSEIDKIKIQSKPAIEGFEMEKVDNKDQLKAIIIPSGTRVIEIPDYLQNKSIGVYNAGIGVYIQSFYTDYFKSKKTLFVYSLYNPKKYKEASYKIIFYAPVSSAYSKAGNSYIFKDKILKAVPSTLNRIFDEKELKVMSTGSGYTIANANAYMKKPVEMGKKGPKFKGSKLNSSVVYKERKDGVNFAPNKGISANQFKLASEILQKKGSYLDLHFEDMDASYLYPGAACKISYENKLGKIKELYGVIHYVRIANGSQVGDYPMAISTGSSTLGCVTDIRVYVDTDGVDNV